MSALFSAAELDRGTPLDGILGAGEAMGDDEWAGAGLHAFAVGVDVASLAVDPLGRLASWGMEWVLEHCRPLTSLLDDLTGVPADVQRCASGIEAAAAAVRAGAPGAGAASGAGWLGEARVAHDQARAALLAEGERLASRLTWVGRAVRTLAGILEAVRAFVRGLLADVIVTVGQQCALTGITLGLATPALVTLTTMKVAAATSRAAAKVAELTAAVARLDAALGRIAAEILDCAQRLSRGPRGAVTSGRPVARHRGASRSEQKLAELDGAGARLQDRVVDAVRPSPSNALAASAFGAAASGAAASAVGADRTTAG